MPRVLPLRCFLFLLTNYTNFLVCFSLFALVSDDPEVFLPKYPQTAILHAAHFRWVVNTDMYMWAIRVQIAPKLLDVDMFIYVLLLGNEVHL